MISLTLHDIFYFNIYLRTVSFLLANFVAEYCLDNIIVYSINDNIKNVFNLIANIFLAIHHIISLIIETNLLIDSKESYALTCYQNNNSRVISFYFYSAAFVFLFKLLGLVLFNQFNSFFIYLIDVDAYLFIAMLFFVFLSHLTIKNIFGVFCTSLISQNYLLRAEMLLGVVIYLINFNIFLSNYSNNNKNFESIALAILFSFVFGFLAIFSFFLFNYILGNFVHSNHMYNKKYLYIPEIFLKNYHESYIYKSYRHESYEVIYGR